MHPLYDTVIAKFNYATRRLDTRHPEHYDRDWFYIVSRLGQWRHNLEQLSDPRSS